MTPPRPPLDLVAVIGAGAWGTALANACARAGVGVTLWTRDAAQAGALSAARENGRYLPGIALEPNVAVTADLGAVSGAQAVLLVVPAQELRGVARRAAPHIAPGAALISCAKGIERGTLAFTSAIIAEEASHAAPAVLSGPSFASDVAAGLPTAVTVAAADADLAEHLARRLSSPAFRLYHASDVTGVEIGGAAKNVLAIAAGIAAGRGLGASAGAALIARGFAELRRLGLALGGQAETLMGLSGLGDLVLTATGGQSRNFAYGVAIGEGRAPMAKLAEGVFTASALVELARRHGVEMPIACAVEAVLQRALSVPEAVAMLLDRAVKGEG